ncbi:MAG TPA: hypothetical protein VFA07_19325 [Chthonomonadaceae bacterium]|nr:hypothetical protein [Chthonomonadaceae bacterium]
MGSVNAGNGSHHRMTENGAARGALPAAREVLAQLRARFPDSAFLALGQTVFWDEPVKAVLRRLLDSFGLGGRMVLGIHDTDYFAKTRVRLDRPGRFVLLPHNDGTTKDLWSAAGEISTLFGSETFPSRHDYARNGLPFDKLAAASPMGRQAFIDAMTEAWGWRGLVYTGSRDLIVHRLALREVGAGILEMLDWGFDNALAQVLPDCCQGEARKVADTVRGWCQDYIAAHPDKHLTHLYQDLLPRLYALLLGQIPENITVDCTAHLLLLNLETASLPRFRFVNLFLDPSTRDTAISAYNAAVAGSEIYTLDRFGAGALPFDVVDPRHGRGTLRVTPRVVFVETRQPVAIGLKKPVESVQELAEALTAKLGDHVTLVGKAVSLISMLAQEFIFVFNEEGSMYVRRTRHMNDLLAQQGIALDLRPILRMRYATWDALTVAQSTLRLPDHLAATFGRQTITTPEFAGCWQQVVAEQGALCQQLANTRKPLEMLAYLGTRDPVTPWAESQTAYRQAKETLLELRRKAVVIQEAVQERYRRLAELKARQVAIQQAKGAHFRATSEWTPTETERRAAFDQEFAEIERQKQALCTEIRDLRAQRRAIERGPEASALRARLAEIEEAAELAKLQLVRNALLTIEGLTHTNHRPSAWWLPMLDSCGAWFQRIVETTGLYTESLLSDNA